eukprot:2917584-Prymnesium_polylepis.1
MASCRDLGASWSATCRGGAGQAHRARARRTRTGSHIDGDHTAPTRSQTQERFSAAPCADGEGQGSAQG